MNTSLESQQKEEMKQFLTFALTNETEAMLPTEQMVEILNLDFNHQIVSIPDLPNSVMGVHHWRQQLIWLVDCPALLGLKPLYAQNILNHKVIIIKHQDQKVGIGVYEIGQIIRCQPDSNRVMVLDAEKIFNLISKR